MNEKTLIKLEYPKIIEQLKNHASSVGGKRLCENLKPMTSLEQINRAQEETSCAFTRLVKKGNPSFYGLIPVDGSLKRLEIGGTLGSGELLNIQKLLRITGQVKSYGRQEQNDDTQDLLNELFDQLMPLTPLSTEIARCILSEDEISDEASPTLKHIRIAMQRLNDKIHSTLTQLVNGRYRTYLQDPIITMRGDRYCIPVKAEYKNQVPGMVHDQSSTGSTLFIEPMTIVNLNNELKELYAKENDEIQVILATLSASTGEYVPEIRRNYHVLCELDFIFAKGSLSLEENASKPLFNTQGIIHIRSGRHPLLDQKTVVPITVTLGEDFNLLIITGPNTGGKTVSLKTIGLFTLMGQSGLHIPALDRSKLCIFKNVFADIGDEQSIEQSLSTFSSHMTNIVSFLDEANRDSLVLFDELGAGTDPTEGAALAISILDHLFQKQVRCVATTHYSELKVYAMSTPGIENASCEFDVETLRPTYRLLIGIPGKSNAFAIASKLGLSDNIIEKAREQLSSQDESFEDLLTDLDASRKELEQDREEIKRYKNEISSLKNSVEKEKEKLRQEKERKIREATEEAREILSSAKAEADEIVKTLRKMGSAPVTMADVERERERLRKKMSGLQDKNASLQSKPAKAHKPEEFKLGESVKVLSLNVKGHVIAPPDRKGLVQVQMGIIKSKFPIGDLEIIDEEPLYLKKSREQKGNQKMKMGKSFQIRPEINLLGKTVDEAISSLDKYLDDAYLAHLPSVRVVHGKGTGALRKGVHEYLKRQNYIKSFRLGEFGEGDSGVTIVEFK
ncbi:DNA mismatch repair protein MutS2 [Aequitasia blattaphilus]|uniref:Endonuclease MutS2 n=1 Tax=Aequitasia blattaphilus TaxID=2949332 RepID=A0ABT1E4X1_9FIRM|nr:endonuclease MutS2 [Aequitasia blattaphilus]MCP1100894.1 endonuclease MutS2 [Aequitasia blattaphilus]MCR8613534.1 endonuclease MutS2 [Aequitasia blattaphilus]